MTVAWVTHHLPVDDTGGGKWLPGQYRGGAEMSDAAYRDCAPPWIDIELIPADEWERALGYERIVITGTDLLTEDAMFRLAEEEPMVFVHHEQDESPGRMTLIDNAAPFVCHTPAHLEREQLWTEPKWTELVLSHFDTSECRHVDKHPFALWAARNHPMKGLNQAKIWAFNAGFDLVAMHSHPRDEVLKVMSMAEVFVHLPLNFESEGRAVMEAVLSGCRIETNKNVGITSLEGWDDKGKLREMVDEAGVRFWECVIR
jgi:hypothetical protein